jgi:hypothetical protein
MQENAHVTQGVDGLRKQPFTAGLVDGRLSGFNDGDAEAFLRRRDRRGQACWPTPDDQNIRRQERAPRRNPPVGLFRARLPAQKNQLGAESGSHRGENAESSGLWAAMAVHIFENKQDGGGGNVADLA